MKVARVHTADGQTRTIKLSELQPARTRPIADMRNVPEMGHNMTADAPSVRKAKAEAAPVRGQAPTIKVKQEPAEVQAALTQPPAPVRAADAARVGQRDPQSGRTILQPSNDLVQNERLANQAAPELNTRLSHIAASIQGLRNGSAGDALALRSRKASAHSALTRVDAVKFDRLRPQKGLQRLQEKVADGKTANTIGDNLAAQIIAPTVKAKDQIIAELHREFPVISVDDKFLEAREKAGYPSANVQVRMRNGSTAEVQIVAPEIQKKTDLTHRLYTLGRNYPEGSPERAYYWNQAAAIHTQALERFQARTAPEQFVSQLVPGQRVVLRNGQTGKIVDFADKTSRIVVRTSKGLRTVRRADVLKSVSVGRVQIASSGQGTREAEIVRPIRRGEKMADLLNELMARTWETQLEHTIITFKNGERYIVSGGEGGVDLTGLEKNLRRVLIHTHSKPGGISDHDHGMLKKLGQKNSYIYEMLGARITKFRRKR